jgi:uncharacterized protein involved in exopolysaccharide biosynthesis
MSEQNDRSDGISVYELIDIFSAYKWLISGFALLGAGLAFAFVTVVLHPVWEASAILEIGRITESAAAVDAGNVSGNTEVRGQIELTPNVVARMTHPSFYLNTLPFLGSDQAGYGLARRELRTLSVTQVKNTELIDVRLRAHSPEDAKKLLLASIANLKKVHDEKAAKLIAVLAEQNGKEIALINTKLQEVAKEEGGLRQRLFSNNNWNSFDATLSATVLQNKAAELYKLSQTKMLLENRQDQSRIIPTGTVGDVYVSDGAVSPNVPLFVGVGFALGLLGALCVVYVHKLIRNRPV